MRERSAFIVVGADSLVGEALIESLKHRGHEAYGTTRRLATVSEQRLFFDFEAAQPFKAPPDATYAYVVAAATNYERCERDPQARVVNEELTPRAIANLLGQGLFVTFISTNSVFGGDRPWPQEEDPHAPQIPYAAQKSRAEDTVRTAARNLRAESRLSIVRLTKILSTSTPPLPAWLAAWRRLEAVQPFADLVFAPMSVKFVGESLTILGEKRVSGDLHLSGAENVTYVELAHALASRLNIQPDLVQPTTAAARGISIPFKPRFSGLGMARTTRLTGLRPQSLHEVVADLVS